MKREQADFEANNLKLSNEVSTFADRFQDENNFEETATEAKNIMKRLNQAMEQAKKFNMQESLTGEEETNYEGVKQIV